GHVVREAHHLFVGECYIPELCDLPNLFFRNLQAVALFLAALYKLRSTGSRIASASSRDRRSSLCGARRGMAMRNSSSSTTNRPITCSILARICPRRVKSCRCQTASSTSTTSRLRISEILPVCEAIFLPTAEGQAACANCSSVVTFSFPRTRPTRSIAGGKNH